MHTVALELHASSNIWNPDGVLSVLDLMGELGYNALILHEVGIMEKLTYPSRYFGTNESLVGINRRYRSSFRTLYRLDPGRRSRPYQHLSYMRWIARRAAERGIALYLNNKELSFPDSLLRLLPELTVDGHPCPTAPEWTDYLFAKYDELFTDFPELEGTITAPGTGESKLSIAAGWCPCERCKATDPSDWYRHVIEAMHAAAQEHQKVLVVRDFVFTKSDQDSLTDGISSLPNGIVVALKNTPHDYYPTFPDNPRIGAVGDRPQWVEFDTMGQYFGWGILPSVMIDDLRRRLDYARQHGVEGILVRIDWEGLEGHSSLRTVNSINLDSAAAIAADPAVATRAIYAAWANRNGALADDATEEQREAAVDWIASILGGTWEITRRTLFSHDTVFSDSSQFPVSIDHAYWLGEEKNSLRDWDPSKHDALSWDSDNVDSLLAEKKRAVELSRDLLARAESPPPGIDAEWHGDFLERLRVSDVYVRAFELAATAVFAGRHVRESGDNASPHLVEAARTAVVQMRDLINHLRTTKLADWHPAAAALSADRLETLMEDVAGEVGA